MYKDIVKDEMFGKKNDWCVCMLDIKMSSNVDHWS